MVLRLPDSWPNCNLAMLVFEERGKPEYPEKNLSEQGRELTTNSTNIWRRRRELNPGHIGERRVLSPLRHPCSPEQYSTLFATSKQVFNFWVKLRKKSVYLFRKLKKKNASDLWNDTQDHWLQELVFTTFSQIAILVSFREFSHFFRLFFVRA